MNTKHRHGSVAIRTDLDLVMFADGVLWIARVGKPSCGEKKIQFGDRN